MIGIYMYENINDHKKYIGQSTNIERRRLEHLKWPSPYSKIDEELLKLGENNFIFSVLEECSTSSLDEKEKYWIDYYDSINSGYNLVQGGQSYRGESNPASKLTEKEVKQIIKLLEENKKNNSEIAKIFSVHRNTIDLINRCKTWNHLHNYKKNIRQENLNTKKLPHSTMSGENSASSKITEEKALKIIDRLKKDTKSLAQISREEKISLNIVYDINRCRTWRYLHNYKNNIRNEYKEGDDAIL